MFKKDRADVAKTDDLNLDHMRHSCAHMLAQAVLQMFPEAKLGIGPTIENGFYYDFELPRTLIPEDLKILEDKMIKIANERQTFERLEEPVDKAIEFYQKAGQPYKAEIAADLKAEGVTTVSFYENRLPKTGEVKFSDLCRGGHTENTGKTGAFKLTKIAGAYWRGDEKRTMLQRIYGLCFPTKKDLAEYEQKMEEAKKRDHRKLGKELELFTIVEEIGAGLALFYPKGAVVRRLIEEYITELQETRGYQPIWIPHITKGQLYEISGHLAKYDALYPPMKLEEEADYYLKPMNCPHFMMLYKSMPHSYRELPVRYVCTTTNYRYEKSGELSGLTRVRALTQDDCHVFMRPDQIEEEINLMLDMVAEVYKTFGFEDFWVRISTHDPANKDKYIGDPKIWTDSEATLQKLIEKRGWKHDIGVGEAAFYGPKLDFIFKDVLGRSWQLSTIQLDMNLPQRFELEYVTAEGTKHRPVVVHRAILGSTERFLGILIEHFGGAFPVWLAPVQVAILPVSEKQVEYAQKVCEQLRAQRIRVHVDDANESLGKKIRAAELQKIPYILVVGDKEIEQNAVTVRNRKSKEQTVMKVEEFTGKVLKEVQEHAL